MVPVLIRITQPGLWKGRLTRHVRAWIICDADEQPVGSASQGCGPSVPSVLKKTESGPMVLLTQPPSKLPLSYKLLAQSSQQLGG